MNVDVLPDSEAVARDAAMLIAAEARATIPSTSTEKGKS
jgi:hypothetical protein